jgi:gliding motility-associated-like protein
VQLIASNAFGCRDTSETIITVHPNATAQFQTFYTPACAPTPGNFINTSINADAYEWNFGDGSPVSNETNPTHIFENTGLTLLNYTVTLVASTAFGCNDTATTNIAVFPEPDFDFTIANDTGCTPFDVQFPLVPGAISYFWTFGDGTISIAPNPLHTYGNNTLAPITYEAELVATSAFGCQDTATAEITVNPEPITQFTANLTAGCSPLTVNFENQSILADSVVWTYGDGNTSDTLALFHEYTFENNTNNVVTYTVLLEGFTSEGCSTTFTRDITVYPNVIADFSHPDDVCSPVSFMFENNSVNGNVYQWDLGNGIVSVAQEPLGSYTNTSGVPETYEIELVATSVFGCEDTARSSITVFPKPDAFFSPNITQGCSPLTVNFENTSTLADSYEWNYGDGEVSDTLALNHAHTFTSTTTVPQDFQVSLIASNTFGCSDTTQWEVTVFPEVISNFTGSPLQGCSPLEVNFVNQSFGASTFQWQFGNGNEAFSENPSHMFVNTSDTIIEYEVMMIAQSAFGCVDTSYESVTVFPLPNVNFGVAGIEGCYPAEFTFANFTEGATSFDWNYGDGTESQNGDSLHTHVFVNAGTEIEVYTVELTATSENGCVASNSLDVEVIPEIIADVTPPPGGCSPYTAEFVNNSVGAFTYYWDFGDGNFSDAEEPTYEYTNPGANDEVYTVTFVAQSLWNCADTIVFDIPVLGLPEALFVASPSVQQFPESTVDITNLSSANPGAIYSWNWGDGNTTETDNVSIPDEYTYETWGEYEITLLVGNEICQDTAIQNVIIEPPLPIASFIGEGKGCMPLVVEFENTSIYGESFLWNFGDGDTSEEENPTHVYYESGTYNVTLTVTGPGGDQDIAVRTEVAVVHPRAEAFFTVNPPVITIPDQVFFLNLSSNASEYFWDFGDGNTSTEFSPYNFYESTGWHPVTLIANNEFNCPDTFMVEQAVLGNTESRIAFPNAFTPSPSGPNGGMWTVDDMFNNDIFFPIYKGVEEFEMQIFNRWGELLFESKDIRQGWDGYYRGSLCQQDVYVWRVNVTFADGGRLTESGDVTLIR